MPTIGTLEIRDARFGETITTLSVNLILTFQSTEEDSRNAPDFRVFAAKAEIGVAWWAKKDGKDYLSIQLDDPTFPEELQCRALKCPNGHVLVWSR
jgi:uncharacterized protein (DUF736 family)